MNWLQYCLTFSLALHSFFFSAFASDHKTIAITIDDLPGRDSAAGSAVQILDQIRDGILSDRTSYRYFQEFWEPQIKGLATGSSGHVRGREPAHAIYK